MAAGRTSTRPLPRLLVRRVLAAPLAVPRKLQPLRIVLLVFHRSVVPPLADGTRQRHNVASHFLFILQFPPAPPAIGDASRLLLHDPRDDAGADRAAALPDGEPQLLLQRHRRDQRHLQVHAVSRHHHLHPRRPRDVPRPVRRPQVELRPVPREERRVPPPLFLRQHVHLRPELQVRVDRPRLRQHHPPLDLFLLHPPQQHPEGGPRPRPGPRPAGQRPAPHPRPPPPRPVPTVPRPVIVKMSSTAIRKRFSTSRTGVGMYESTASINS